MGKITAKIKICGLTRSEDIRAVDRYRPDYIGFVFARDSRRYIPPDRAAEFKKGLSSEITAVGVFVNEAKEQIADLLWRGIIDMAQLHGQEPESEIRWIRQQTGRPVIKAVSVSSEADIAAWEESCADYLLFDNGAGGTGQTFDWGLLHGCKKPYFLAGGIHSRNLEQALQKGAYAVDISGGVETDGYKDPAKIAEVIGIVRSRSYKN